MNIRQVAQVAGVSSATVSRTLKNSFLISPEKKKHILETVRNLHYYPDKNRPGPKMQKQRTFGLLVPSEEKKKFIYRNTNFFSSVFTGFKEGIGRTNHILVISYCNNNLAEALKRVDLSTLQAMAIVHTTEKDDKFIEENKEVFSFPFIVINRDFPKNSGISYVEVNEVAGGYLAVNYLQTLGHKRIACLALWQGFSYLKQRVKGYKEAMAKEGGEGLVIKCRHPEKSYAAVKDFIKKDTLTAIFITEEELLPGVLSAVKDAGRRVPEDISIVAYNDYGFSLSQTPQITTVRLPSKELGYLAGQVLHSSVKIREEGTYCITLMPKLIERNSCRQMR